MNGFTLMAFGYNAFCDSACLRIGSGEVDLTAYSPGQENPIGGTSTHQKKVSRTNGGRGSGESQRNRDPQAYCGIPRPLQVTDQANHP